MDFEHVIYELDDRVGVITLNRPEAANAQSPKVLDELDAAWQEAERDPQVKVIVLKSNGKHFSAGHDLSGWNDGELAQIVATAEGHYEWETNVYLGYALRWRDVPKPSIAAVQGKCIAAGLMLCWPCDLIIAADNAEFSDPVLAMGMNGVELHAHTWELGPRKAKEILFTGGSVTATQAEQLGMVNRVVPLDDLVSATMEMAHRIAQVDEWALRMAKRSVNQTMDVQGYRTAIASAFDMHHLGHIRARIVTGGFPALAGLAAMKERGK
jgi:enoyl-CoA hydratase/carnithine racemase